MKKFLILFLFFQATLYAQKPVFTTAKVKAATVYFNAAEISQTASVNLPAGTHEIVVKNVANWVNENSIQIGTSPTLTVLSVQFTDNYISEYEVDTNSPSVKKVKDSILIVQKEIAKLSNSRISEGKTIELLDKNQQVSGQNSGLNVTELMKMVEYYKTKRAELSNNINALAEKEQKLAEVLKKLNDRLEVNNKNEEKISSGKLILQVMNEVAGNVPLEISYLTNSATWAPFYDLRANSIASPIDMMYKAQVTQSTGIDWKNVKLTLSSGLPNQNNQAPLLQAWFLRYGYVQDYRQNAAPINELQEVVVQGIATKKDKVMIRGSVSNFTAITENQLNISFDIDIPYDILSNGKKHSVALKEIKLPATYKYYAAPTADKEAFLLAEISDYSKYNLLKGEANIIFEGMYVGKTFVDPNQTSDTLNLSMGRDKKISIKREKVVDKSGTKFLSANKVQTFTFETTVRNNKKEAIQLTLKDQYPLSSDKEIEIELKQSDNAKVNAETGILTWDLNLKPNETRKIRISYTVKYPKNKIIDNL
ncbi:MAG: mucoidy inhibitor MuiA family protein [Flavobacteriaceae bacterium]|uniref:DUF4139 domain-containing protein n=1 Tax=Flavobacterium sp. Leaf359 TaxID=1736351 RepID=UPI0006FDABED|nr:DUF4139 domain-containing protein [Flavobacterium sp. Leaf359]KQS46352.1 hypothetical protein ASG38_11115 [Flavobacterium sp. Leaf359]PZO28493.1 MAG: mucoidy inhibitor MuiA family protein [Flavobacteriaceae bacterium]